MAKSKRHLKRRGKLAPEFVGGNYVRRKKTIIAMKPFSTVTRKWSDKEQDFVDTKTSGQSVKRTVTYSYRLEGSKRK